MKVLVTDADQKHALAAVRALGRQGISVHAGATSSYAVSFLSRYCDRKAIYPDPFLKERDFVRFLQNYINQNKIDVLLPIGYNCNVAVSKHKNEISKCVRLAISDYDQMSTAADKRKTMDIAESIGLKIPKIYRKTDEIENYPIVVKDAEGSGVVHYVNSAEELARMDGENALIQEYIPGQGYGFYGLFHHGEPRAIFMHRRRREFPVTGGASTAAESYYDDDLKDQGTRLLKALNWHGVAMVEMKRDQRDGKYKLMEINPKFWGSLDLAIEAGINFPYLTALMAFHGDVDPVFQYDHAQKFCWPFPQDLLHLIARPQSLGQILCDFFDPTMRTNLRLGDPFPNFYMICSTPFVIVNRLIKGRLYSPHGKPQFMHGRVEPLVHS